MTDVEGDGPEVNRGGGNEGSRLAEQGLMGVAVTRSNSR